MLYLFKNLDALKIGLIKEAIQNYNTSIQIKENNLEAHFNLGNLLYDEKNFDEALTFYEKVIEINREFPKSYFLIAQIKSVQGKFEEAKNYFLKAMSNLGSQKILYLKLLSLKIILMKLIIF